MGLKDYLVARFGSPAAKILVAMDAVTKPEESTCTIMGVSAPPSLRAVFKVVSFDSKIILIYGLVEKIWS